ncbi:hypothetical protein PC41400_07925 [Paenibacillus chitinolyticus]|uniref:Uncharacterized protein n=1 Tax=Paenibacillus chitinolyticus TaxID=79263 RepID=A0A410WSX0_9BACL|nr:hypothetical protein [Paenibacillus chitinolyticus]MCY9588649.1 hypothetical protein [Paenibacillus chitinolyticus]MCY9595847.1 hypothetical protein [Paenibacillus chitinolyticus]QAV17596.1 hypothetical protein PC41400_07925 [Paenibacillus chitinolyticus]
MNLPFAIAIFINLKGKTELYYGETEEIENRLSNIHADFNYFQNEEQLIAKLKIISETKEYKKIKFTPITSKCYTISLHWIFQMYVDDQTQIYYGEKESARQAVTNYCKGKHVYGKGYPSKFQMLWQLEYYKTAKSNTVYIPV